jgi:hypothetical protein
MIPAADLFFSQKGISAATKEGVLLDDLAISMAQGWKGDPLKVVDVGGSLVSLDNRRLAIAKMLDISVPVSRVGNATPAQLITMFNRDGVFSQILVRGTGVIIDMFGGIN